ncbi:MAG TPA: outer membrane protein assembly factor BamA [Clostridiales bacterium]|nr:outer membrane protein assembly factor BamA [Clostridiales bacterium]HQP68927.1 outer membrane protein assembly factor BamA [Clostridiales bacterium]
MKLKLVFILLFISALYLSASKSMKGFAEAPRISDIEFYGIYPFFSNELLNRMSVYPGSVYDEEKIELQKKYLSAYLNSKGYDSVVVRTETEEISEKLRLIKIKVEKGGYFTIEKISISGNNNMSGLRLKKEMKTWWRSFMFGAPGRLIPDELEIDLEKITALYKYKGYVDCSVSYELIKDSIERTSEIKVIINEGPEYNIDFSGNEFFSDRKLKEQTDKINEGKNGSVALRKSLRTIRNMYREEGFSDAKVNMKDTLVIEEDRQVKSVTVEIKEGVRPLVTDITFEGNSVFSGSELGKYLNSVVRRWWRRSEYFRKDIFEDDERNIKAFYGQNGFISADAALEVKYSRKRDSVRILAEIKEGTRTLIGRVSFEGIPQDLEVEVGKISSELEGKPYNKGMITGTAPRIKGHLAAKGYIFAEVNERTEFSKDSLKADICFCADIKNKASTGSIFVAGNLKTKERSIRKLLKIKEGEPFSVAELSDGLKNLRNQKIFRSVSSYTSETGSDTLDILVSVEEYPPYYFQASGGYESYSGAYASLHAGNKNLFGRNKELSIKTDLSFVKQTVTTAFTEPVLIIPELSGTLSIFWEREDISEPEYQTETIGIGAGVNYRWKSSLQSIIQAQIEHRKLNEENISGADSNTVMNTGSLKFIQLWDRRDSFMVPRKGVYANLDTEFSTGIDNNEDDFIKYKFDLKYFFTPFGPVTFAFAARLNFLQMTDPDADPAVDQLFYLGGTSTVRGINENYFAVDAAGEPAGAKLTALFIFEPRYEFRKNWEIPFFLDTGLMSETTEGGGETLRSTAGTGLRYITPIGAMGVLWGFPLDIKDGWQEGVFHFSVGYTF